MPDVFNGIYICSATQESGATHAGAAVGFVPYNLQLFRLTPLLEKVIRAFPGLDALKEEFPKEQLSETVQALIQKKILRPDAPPPPPIPPLPDHFSDIVFMLNDGDNHMSRSQLEHAVAFFLQETREALFKSLTLFSSDPDRHLPLLQYLLKQVWKKAPGNVRFILRTPFPPRSLALLRLAGKYKMIVHLDISPSEGESLPACVEAMVRYYQDPRNRRHLKLLTGLTCLAALHPGTEDMAQMPAVLELFQEIGVKRLYLDYLCRTCRAGDTAGIRVEDEGNAEALARMAVNFGGNGNAGFWDGTPVFHSLLSAERRFNGCSAGINYCVVAPDGGIYACLRTAGKKAFCLGNSTDGTPDTGNVSIQHPERRQHCAVCIARYICGGGATVTDTASHCAAGNGDYCRFMRWLLAESLLRYGLLDPMDKNIVLSDTRKIRRWLPFLKPLTSEPEPFSHSRLLTVRSNSMAPVFVEGDQVRVVPLQGQGLSVGDIVCYGRPTICHRIIARYRRRGVGYVIEKGDAVLAGRELPEQEITGKVVALIREGKEINLTRFFSRLRNRGRASLSLARHIATVSRVMFKWKIR